MDPFGLTEQAISDIDEIWVYLMQNRGVDFADRVVTQFFKTFYRLSDVPGLGHRRPDLTERDAYFLGVYPYLIVYSRVHTPLLILAVLHAKRDIAGILAGRPQA